MADNDVVPMNSLSLSAAQRVANAALDAARAKGVIVCIAVCNPAGDPIVTLRMDGAPRFSIDIALNKAYTVASFNGMPTHDWWPALCDDPSLVHGFTHTERLIVFPGGVPVRIDGAVVGAIGISGGSADQDREIAEAAVLMVGDS
jgi:glc operon protein GlcG